MKTKRPNWKLLLLCAIPFVPLLAATSFRDGAYRAVYRAVPAWQQRIDSELFEAIEKNDLTRVKLLVSRGANVNFHKSLYETPLSYALSVGYNSPDFALASYLVEHGADPNAATARTDQTIFFWFAKNFLQNKNDAQFAPSVRLSRLMLDAGIKTNGRYKKQDILFQAVQLQSVSHVRKLLKNGVDPNAPIRTRGWGATTPLLAAVDTQNLELVEMLLRHRADPDLVGGVYDSSVSDRPLLQIFSNREFSKPISTREFKIAASLIRHGADVNARAASDFMKDMTPIYNGWTSLMYAAFANDVETTKLLLRHGANPKLRDEHGKTALDYARQKGHGRIVRVLDIEYSKSRKKRAL